MVCLLQVTAAMESPSQNLFYGKEIWYATASLMGVALGLV